MVSRLAFLITGMGRSGTTWLPALLDSRDGLRVLHESLAQWDSRHYWKVPAGQMTPMQFIKARLEPMADKRLSAEYGDVNSYLRYVAREMGEAFSCPVAGLIRDGRWVVRSLMVRGIYQREGYPPIEAPDEFETPFEKCCWYWADAYQRLEAAGVPVWRLEDLTDSYWAVDGLTGYLGIAPPPVEKWERVRNWRMNRSKGRDTSKAPVFTERQRAAFERIAGVVQERHYG